MNFPDTNILLLYAVLSICWVVSISWLLCQQKSAIPVIPGSDGLISSYLVALRFLRRSNEVIALGYNQDRNGVFRFARLFVWEYVAIGRKRVLELAAAPPDILSVDEALADTFQTDYTLGPGISHKAVPYRSDAGASDAKPEPLFPARFVLSGLLFHIINLLSDWKLVQIFPASVQVVARTSNRLFVDLPIWRTKLGLAQRILTVNAVAIHTTAMGLTNALYDLTTYPKHISPMREEAERVIAAQGWTKAALNNMHKLDSFLRESMRLNSSTLTMRHKVVAKDGFRFSDGTTIPYGSFVNVPGTATHHDPGTYPIALEADVFDGFRLSRLREERHGLDAGGRAGFFNRHMISTAPEHVVFGHGQHACPGRFFAATELKGMLAHILINYDIKAETDLRPPEISFAEATMPNPQGKIWIRKREMSLDGEN
ncbi:Cytochrome P450 [Mycena venus]|uniref:Cytochrome P450 n=1 Tax=Mycena venus TaxID=2733690 RepID=A0A8H7D697_9AGAR|nr:Cytochrome P450 [Mycena venus]